MEAASLIKQNFIYPIVMLTGQGSESVAVSAIKQGAQDYLSKDALKGEELYRAMGNAMEKASLMNQVEEQRVALAHLAYHDALTGLPNRLMFTKELTRAINRAMRYNRIMALLYIDLDNFKTVNDTLGHNYGDLLLKTAVERIQDCVRKSDVVARLGGDEFAVVLDEVNQFYDASVVARRILDRLSESMLLNGDQEVFVGASIGIASYPLGGKNADELIETQTLRCTCKAERPR